MRSPDGRGSRIAAAMEVGWYLEAMTKRELEADAGEACELPIAAGGDGVTTATAAASTLRLSATAN